MKEVKEQLGAEFTNDNRTQLRLRRQFQHRPQHNAPDFRPQALPATDDRISEVPGQIGAHDAGGDLGALEFNLECRFTGTALTETALQDDVRNLTDHLTDDSGEPRMVTLSFEDETDKTWDVRYSGDGIDVGRGLGSDRGQFTLSLIAPDPRAYGTETSTSKTITSSTGTVSVSNEANVETPVEITIENNGTNSVNEITLKAIE